ncbi:hypothetical protein MYX07_05150, partial [Patescibacteria group bacterium AH-259-L07]|nr:hypothetical protein [Patescibacteria group bacterium AH-259-L07]
MKFYYKQSLKFKKFIILLLNYKQSLKFKKFIILLLNFKQSLKFKKFIILFNYKNPILSIVLLFVVGIIVFVIASSWHDSLQSDRSTDEVLIKLKTSNTIYKIKGRGMNIKEWHNVISTWEEVEHLEP